MDYSEISSEKLAAVVLSVMNCLLDSTFRLRDLIL